MGRGNGKRLGHLLPQRLGARRSFLFRLRPLARRLGRPCMRRALRRQTLQTIGDEGARPGAGAQIAFREQAFEHVERRLARDAQLRGEIARGRQTRAAGEAPFEYAGTQLPVDLSGQIVSPVDRDMDLHPSGYLKYPRNGYSERPMPTVSLPPSPPSEQKLTIRGGGEAAFTEKEISDLTLLIIAINGWNRIAVSFRKMPE